jgi:hypothetical protein
MESVNEKLARVRVYVLPNELHFRFHTENEALYTRYNPESLGIGEFIGPFRFKLVDLDTAPEKRMMISMRNFLFTTNMMAY